jgi:DNA-binding NtrC family response regulator
MNQERILYVDDSEPNRVTLSALLECEGYDVSVASSCSEARQLIASGSFDLFVLDQDLGDGLGSDLAPAVRARFPGAKVILLSGAAPSEEVQGSADACILKGSPLSVMLTALARP